MPGSNYPLIAREGWPILLGLALLVPIEIKMIVSGWVVFGLLALIPTVILLVSLFMLFRDPPREVPSKPLAVVSPVDGTVVTVAPTDKSVLEGEAIRLEIRVNNWGAYTARSPIEGKVLNLRDNVNSGSRLLGISGLWVQNEQLDDVVLLFKGPKFLGRPAAFVGYGERVGQGQRCAFTRLAQCAEVYMPLNSRVSVTVGDYVKSGSTILATLVHK